MEIPIEAILVEPVGSRVTCKPAPTDTDCDWLVLCAQEHVQNHFALQADGWEIGGSEVDDGDDLFESWTKGEDNLIITNNVKFFLAFVAATSVCKRFNLLNKPDRIAVFQAVLYSRTCT